MSKTSIFTSLTAVGAYIIIPLPFSPVPITFQIFFVLLSGILLGKKYGPLSQIIYLILGTFGLPIFSGGRSGIGILLGPTGGFLISFVLVSWIVSYSKKNKFKNIIIYFCAVLTNYIIGCAYFAFITGTSILSSINMTIIPFIPGDIFKIVLLTLITPKLIKRMEIESIS
jgi:biotin transport system substrate-specific component